MSNDTSRQSPKPEFIQAGKINNRRALAFYAIGVCIGLVLGGIGLFNARGTSTNRVPEENLALVNQRPILRSDFIIQLEGETGLPFEETSQEERLRVLDEMIREELFVQRGLELDFAETDQDTRYALYSIVEQQILADVYIGEPPEDKLMQFFQEHRDQFTSNGSIDAHHLIMNSQDMAMAEEAVTALREGVALDEVKRRFALVEEEYFGDEFYYLASYHLGEYLFSQVSDLQAGEVSDPIKTDDGFHIIQVLSNTRPEQQSFEEAGSEVKSVYFRYEKAQRLNNMLNFLRERSTILIADDYKDDYNPEDFTETF